MDLDVAVSFARQRRRGVLTTQKRDGRPQLSNVVYAMSVHGRITISMGVARAKHANLLRDPRVSLHVTNDDFSDYVVLEAVAEVAPATVDPNDATADLLVALHRGLHGEHPDWDTFRAEMVTERNTVVSFDATYAYGLIR